MIYLLLGLLVFAMNVLPAFMPPTWIILVFFFVQFKLLPIPVVIIGAIAATTGRVLLYYLARHKVLKHLPKKSQKNYEALGKLFHIHRKVSIPTLFLYAFLPIPSNQIYIAAGLAKIDVRLIAALFFTGRLISYSSWIATTHFALKGLFEIFKKHLLSPHVILLEFFGFLILFLLSQINWSKFIKNMQNGKT